MTMADQVHVLQTRPKVEGVETLTVRKGVPICEALPCSFTIQLCTRQVRLRIDYVRANHACAKRIWVQRSILQY
jgi:hypothetical protein